VSASKSNELRLSLAEWLYRMSENSVPYQARALAVYAVAFKATSNEELAILVGMDTKGVADKTYNKWKRYLSENGWVIVKQVTVGRVTTIEVEPAFKETPVTFTDLIRRNPSKFRGSSDATITDTPAVKVTDEGGKNYGLEEQITDALAVEVTADAAQDAPAHTPAPASITTHGNKESSSKIVTYEELASKLASSAREQGDEVAAELSGLNGSAEPMVRDILGWLGPRGEITNARQWLTSTLHTFGEDVTAQSYHKLKTDIATGKLIASPIHTWTRIAQRMKAEPKTAAPVKDTPADKRARIRQHVEAEAAKMKSEKQWRARS
jgi:hypothetical protein